MATTSRSDLVPSVQETHNSSISHLDRFAEALLCLLLHFSGTLEKDARKGESDLCHRQCCGPQRGFVMHITDNLGQEVIRVNRDFKCCAGCNCCAGSDCCAMELCVEAPPGNVIGYVKQQCSFLAPKFDIQDESQQTVLSIEGPVCICQGPCCTWDQEFVVQSSNGQEVGKISKQWSGFVKEYFTQADNFGVSFPMDLDVKVKATMLGAVFLIDFMFFEQKQNNNNN